MAKKKNKQNEGGEKKDNDQMKNENKDDGEKKSGVIVPVVLRIDMDCEGCATKVMKCIRSFEGVESVRGSENDLNKLTVVGNVDPLKLREKVEKKTKKKVELLSPLPKKDKDKDNSGDGDEKKTKNTEAKQGKQPDEKKSKEPPMTTAVLKLNLHCEGCIKKIKRVVRHTKGYQDMSVDRQNDLVTVKGSIDMKSLVETLKEKLKKPVEIVQPKKEKGDGGEKKEKGDGGEKGKSGGGGGGGGGGDVRSMVHEGNMMQLGQVQYGYPAPYMYGSGYPLDHGVLLPVHAPQMFSDENPNACAVM